MRVQRTRHTRAYVQVPNAIAQDHSLSLEARGLITYLLSLPDANRATVERITSLVPNGRRIVSRAMAELEEKGYLVRARVQDPETGRWVTLTSVSDSPTNHIPTVGLPTGPAVGAHPKENDLGCNDLPTPEPETQQRPEGRAGSEGEEKSTPTETNPLTERAVTLLERLAIHNHRLTLSSREARRLAPMAAEWLAEGLQEREIIQTLTAALPSSGVASAAALVTYRLRNHKPEPQWAPVASQTASVTPQAPSVSSDARKRCPECGAVYTLGHPGGLCGACR